MPIEVVHKSEAVFTDDNRDRGVRATCREPIAPPDQESGVFTNSPTGKIILAAAARNHRAKFCHGRRANQRVRSAENPNAKKQPRIWQPFSYIARSPNDARGNRIADRGGDSEPHTKHLQQPSPVVHRSVAFAGRCVSSSGQ